MSFHFNELQNPREAPAKNIKLKDLKYRVLIFLQKGLKSGDFCIRQEGDSHFGNEHVDR